MACDEDILSKNPCNFKLSTVITKNTKKRCALTSEQQRVFFDFVKNDPRYYKHYDTFVFMVETGLRIGELTGLKLMIDDDCIISPVDIFQRQSC